MRITNKLISNNFLSDMQRNLQNLNKIQQQVSSMKNFSKPSDDPVNVERAMQLQTSIDANDQYGTNINIALNWMETTDTTLGQIGTVLTNIRGNLVKSGDAPYTQDERDKINDEVNQQISQLAQLLNTNFKGEYIFGGTAGNSKPVKTVSYDIARSGTDSNGNVISDYTDCVSMEYTNKNGDTLEDIPQVVSSQFDIDNWTGQNLDFSVNGGSAVSLTIDPADSTIDDVIRDLNGKIQSSDLKDKVNVVKTNDGNIKILAIDSSDSIKMSTDIYDMQNVNSRQLSSMDMENIGAAKTIEVSQGVVLDYNAAATGIMTYGSGAGDNMADLMDRIVHHLAGQVQSTTDADGNEVTESTDGAVLGSDGKYYIWKYDSDAAKQQLTGQDLSDIDAASKQALKVRSQIGAKEKRMEDLGNQNSSTKLNLTEVLSKTEDIDITEKTTEYYTMITVYQACLQTGAKIMQPTLMDYIK